MIIRPCTLGEAEPYYMPHPGWPADGPGDSAGAWADIGPELTKLSGYEVTHGPSYELDWAELVSNALPHPGPKLFKIFVTTPCDAANTYPRWRESVSSALEAVRRFGLYRLKICTTPKWRFRPDGVVLYLSADQVPAACGYLYGRLPARLGLDDEHRPTFAMPFPSIGPTPISFIQGERFEDGTFINPEWAGQEEVFSARELRALAYAQSGGGPLSYNDPEIRGRMLSFGFTGERFHLGIQTPDPITAAPQSAWTGYFTSLASHHNARHPDKVRALERSLGQSFAHAVLSDVEASEPASTGSQRKTRLRLHSGPAALFRPSVRRMHDSVAELLDKVGVTNEVAPFWLGRMQALDLSPTTEGFRKLYENAIGDPLREVGAWRLAAALGSSLIPPVGLAVWNGEQGSVQVLIDTASAATPIQLDVRQLEHEQEEANLLDFLMSCVDRPDNWEVTCDGHLLLVDNTQVFGAPGKYVRGLRLTSHRWRRAFIERIRGLAREGTSSLFDGLITEEATFAVRARLVDVVDYVEGVLSDLTASEALIDE